MASKVNLTVILIFILTIGAIGKSSRRLNLEIFSTECTALSALVSTFNCKHLQAGPRVHYFSNEAIYAKDLNDSFELRVRIDGQYLDRNVAIMDYKFDICQNLKTAFKNWILRVAMEEIRRTSNLPYKCPFKAGKLYKLDNFTLTRDIFPSYTPEVNFTSTVNFIYKNVEVVRQIVKGAISLKSPK